MAFGDILLFVIILRNVSNEMQTKCAKRGQSLCVSPDTKGLSSFGTLIIRRKA